MLWRGAIATSSPILLPLRFQFSMPALLRHIDAATTMRHYFRYAITLLRAFRYVFFITLRLHSANDADAADV